MSDTQRDNSREAVTRRVGDVIMRTTGVVYEKARPAAEAVLNEIFDRGLAGVVVPPNRDDAEVRALRNHAVMLTEQNERLAAERDSAHTRIAELKDLLAAAEGEEGF